MGKSPFSMGKSPFLIGKSPFSMGKSTISIYVYGHSFHGPVEGTLCQVLQALPRDVAKQPFGTGRMARKILGNPWGNPW